jgi:DNA repair exonuclease SbcCD ATPase subunit
MMKDGADDMAVTVLFELGGTTYCVVRERKRGKSTKVRIDEVGDE